MSHHTRTANRSVHTFLFVLMLAALMLASIAGPGRAAAAKPTPTPPPGGGGITVTNTRPNTYGFNTPAVTQVSTGANEGCGRFNISDLTELGITNYRVYGGASRFEPVDDGGAFGSPSIAEIKANPAVINWAAWDTQFNRTDGYWWAQKPNQANVQAASMFAQLNTANIDVVFAIRPRDNSNTPTWMPAVPVVTPEERAEWWEHVFATVYYVNVRNNWNIDRWEIHNEPNQTGQGWANNGGDSTEYVEFVKLTTDAINYVYTTFLANRSHNIHAPVLSGNPNRTKWAPEVLNGSDTYFDVFDYHWYGNNQTSTAHAYIDTLVANNPDGVLEPMWNSEWGTYNSSYNTVSDALNYGDQLMQMSDPTSWVMGSDIFSMYYWGTAEGMVRDDGTRQETFYSMKTLLAALNGGKQIFTITGTLPGGVKMMATKDATGFYLAVINRGTGSATQSLTVNVSAHRTTGTGTLTEYSATRKATVAANPVVSGGNVTFTSPANSIVVLRIP